MPQRQTSNAYCQWHAFMFVLKIAMSSWHLREIPPAASLTFTFSRLTVLFTLTLHLFAIFRFCAIFHFMILLRNFFVIIFIFLSLTLSLPHRSLSLALFVVFFLLSTWFKIASNRYDCSLWCKISLTVYHRW